MSKENTKATEVAEEELEDEDEDYDEEAAVLTTSMIILSESLTE